jgi:hypothetical protein
LELDECQSRSQAERVIDRALRDHQQQWYIHEEKQQQQQYVPLFRSVRVPVNAAIRGISDGDLAIQTRTIQARYGIHELIDVSGDDDRRRIITALILVSILSSAAAMVANQALVMFVPDIVRWLIVFVSTFAPYALLLSGIQSPEQLQQSLLKLEVQYNPVLQQRIIQHEAGHFLIGYLLGIPVAAFTIDGTIIHGSKHKNISPHVLNAVTWYPLADIDAASNRASLLGFDRRPTRDEPPNETMLSSSSSTTTTFDKSNRNVPFFSNEGRGSMIMEQQSVFRRNSTFGNLSTQNNARLEWPYRSLSQAQIDALAVVSVAGICAEIMSMGQSLGGSADLIQLRQLMTQGMDEPLTDREQNNVIRYAIGFCMTLLRQYVVALDALTDTMAQGGTLAECVAAIESAYFTSNTNDRVYTPEFEQRRRERIELASLQASPWGKLREFYDGKGDGVLRQKSIDIPENRYVEGKGGGERKQTPSRLQGDDPFYFAVAVAGFFALWASSGGLTLH